jgi:hypothetical protein
MVAQVAGVRFVGLAQREATRIIDTTNVRQPRVEDGCQAISLGARRLRKVDEMMGDNLGCKTLVFSILETAIQGPARHG